MCGGRVLLILYCLRTATHPTTQVHTAYAPLINCDSWRVASPLQVRGCSARHTCSTRRRLMQ